VDAAGRLCVVRGAAHLSLDPRRGCQQSVCRSGRTGRSVGGHTAQHARAEDEAVGDLAEPLGDYRCVAPDEAQEPAGFELAQVVFTFWRGI
jgi:hypothetical protein